MSTYLQFEPRSGDAFNARDVATRAIESGAHAVLLDRDALPPAFFDLSSGVAGELVHHLTLYGIRMAAVVPDVPSHSGPFQDFVREANRGTQFRFFPTREQAAAWLETPEA
ncbi:MAG TPA: DUF4180 domain-containing protein [Longimicrobium sp.]|nr:DUF4180 domain-containing protein [Longimicrobium sp.]